MSWEVYFLKTGRDQKLVKEFIDSLDEDTKSKVIRMIDLLKKHEYLLRMPYSKKISSNLFELRIRGKIDVRIFYSFVNNFIYLTHAFVKKTQTTPNRELETAQNMLKLLS